MADLFGDAKSEIEKLQTSMRLALINCGVPESKTRLEAELGKTLQFLTANGRSLEPLLRNLDLTMITLGMTSEEREQNMKLLRSQSHEDRARGIERRQVRAGSESAEAVKELDDATSRLESASVRAGERPEAKRQLDEAQRTLQFTSNRANRIQNIELALLNVSKLMSSVSLDFNRLKTAALMMSVEQKKVKSDTLTEQGAAASCGGVRSQMDNPNNIIAARVREFTDTASSAVKDFDAVNRLLSGTDK